jgi:death-on-curing protein
LTREQLLNIHKFVLRPGEDHGILNEGMLDLALNSPMAEFAGMEIHSTLQSKAAALMHEVQKLHIFVSGNKRTGYVAADTFLRMNGYELQAPEGDAVEISRKTAQCTVGISLLENWMVTIMRQRS